MANRTVKDAHSVKGTNPQYLIEKIIRTRIYESKFWKEQCFALSAELLVDKAMALRYVGGIYGGNVKPTPFLCLILKMLQIQPDKDIIVEFISQQDFKYVRALGATYMRLTGSSLDCYKYLEPLYLDYRKLRRMNKSGEFELVHMDEYIDELIREERVCDIILPRVQKRINLEEANALPAKENYLEDDMEDVDSSDDEEEDNQDKTRGASPQEQPPSNIRSGVRDWDRPRRSPSPRYRRSRSPHSRRHRDEDRHMRRGGGERRRSRSRDRKTDRNRDDKRRHRDEREHKKHKRDKHDEDGERRHHHKSKKSKKDKEGKRSGMTEEDLEIQQANELRAKLGMPPLRP